MTGRIGVLIVAGALGLMAGAGPARAADNAVRGLPEPRREGGKPLMQALRERRTQRVMAETPLPDQVLADLLWAASGVNRPDGKRTAPSAVNWQEIDVYVALPDGLFVYEAKLHRLRRSAGDDVRASAGQQDFVGKAPAVLILVADRARMAGAGEKDKDFYSAIDAGYISQNIYLLCASEGLATVAVGLIDREALAAKMGLRPEQRVILVQPVGYPAAWP